MTALDRFLQPIKVAGKLLDTEHRAYLMDGTLPEPDMREEAGLGTCNCCDYFIFSKNHSIALIEETMLMEQIKGLKDEYDYLEIDDQTEFINKYIRDENKLKVYGSMLVLCRLSAMSDSVKELLEAKKYRFWLVVSGMETEEDTILFDNFNDRLRYDLNSVLTGKILDGVEIMPSARFVMKLSQDATAP